MNISIDIPDQLINDMIITAIDQGIGYWAREVRLWDNKLLLTRSLTDEPLKNLSSITIIETEDDNGREVEHELKFSVPEHPGHLGVGVRDFSQIVIGLEVMARQYPRHFADVIADDHDAETADVFIQCCLFNKIIYG